jgi:hypothetical protein
LNETKDSKFPRSVRFYCNNANLLNLGLTQLNGRKAKKLGARRAFARRAPNFLVIPKRIA